MADLINDVADQIWGNHEIVYEPRTGGLFTVSGIFKRSYKAIDPQTGVEVQSKVSVLNIQNKQLPQNGPPLEKEFFRVKEENGVTTRFRVDHIEVEGEGTTNVYLVVA